MRNPFAQPPVLYPTHYVWLVFASALDIMFTWIVLHYGGWEINGLASRVLEHYGLTGIVGFKFALVTLVIVLCETIGRVNHPAGRRLAIFAIIMTFVPVTMAVVQLLRHG
jgi:DMSO/TMAO reductase YedYZ heme-binding membrane subunit